VVFENPQQPVGDGDELDEGQNTLAGRARGPHCAGGKKASSTSSSIRRLYDLAGIAYTPGMNTLETDVEVSADGSLKLLSVPHEASPKPKRVIPIATPEALARRAAAFEAIRAMGGLKDVIPDPVAWQREIREDVVLPGRE
jgi:hypothetical protein